jgi:hypothetical protein
MQEESAKMIYKDGVLVGLIKQNGTLKIYTCTECAYGDVETLFNKKSAGV